MSLELKPFISGLGSISIYVEPLMVTIGKSNIDIGCIVDGSSLSTVLSIQLNRSNKAIVIVTRNRVVWEDEALENKTGVTVNASISNAMSSYLHLEILKTVVRYPEDMGSYQCSLLAIDSRYGLVKDHSLVENITGQYKLYPQAYMYEEIGNIRLKNKKGYMFYVKVLNRNCEICRFI